jgi:hypothetical protein
MSTSTNTQEGHEDGTISPAIELLMAQNTEGAKSLHFHIPLIPGSLESEQHLLRELLQDFHNHGVPAEALTGIIKSGHGPDATVSASGLALVVGIENMPPEIIVCTRIKCRQVICMMAKNKGLHKDSGNWPKFSLHTIGRLGNETVKNRVEAVMAGIGDAFLAGGVMNGFIHQRIGSNGILESAEVDLREGLPPLEFEEAIIPKQ